MPGRISMEHQRMNGPTDLKKDRSHAQEGEGTQGAPAVGEPPEGQSVGAHGVNGALPNGLPTTNGHVLETVQGLSDADGPPQLDQSWRSFAGSNKSLGTMMERVAQQCYTDLSRVIGELAEAPVQQEAHQMNGITTVVRDPSAVSLEKKRKLMEFASDQRERFIKTLVLSDWSRRADSMARLVDLKMWQIKQNEAHLQATRAVGQAKLNMIAAKMPNPNIGDAMEILSTGKLSRTPDLGYVQPKPLGPKQLLETLRTMNIALATRINLHEELPPHFRDYSIADGRATFKVQHEFEVDLSIADEDPTSVYYFIDLRLAFGKATGSIPDDIRPHLESRANAALAEHGLRGCYDLLHNFVLTHKINMLRSQAHAMIASRWFDCLRVENMRRSVAVQYWSDLEGAKSWVEIGVSSGRSKNGKVSSRAQDTSSISLRWFRKGVEVQDELSDIDMGEPDLESVMLQVIARHSSWSLRSIAESLSTMPGASTLSMELSTSDDDPADCILSMSLPAMHRQLALRIEPVTGCFALSPFSQSTERYEERINKAQDSSIPGRLASLLCHTIQEQVSKMSALLGWQNISPGITWQQKPQSFFGEGWLHMTVYNPSKEWGAHNALAVTFGMQGMQYFNVRLKDLDAQPGRRIVYDTHFLPLDIDKPLKVSRDSLLELQRLAEAEVSATILAREMQALNVRSRPPTGTIQVNEGAVQGGLQESSAPTWVNLHELMKLDKDESWRSWASDPMRVTYQGIVDDDDSKPDRTAQVQYCATLSLRPGALMLVRHSFMKMPSGDLKISSNGAVALHFYAPLGKPISSALRTILQRMEDYDSCLVALRSYNLKLSYITLSTMSICYSTSPLLSMHLTFPTSDKDSTQLTFHPSGSNSHQRLRVPLLQLLNGPPSPRKLPYFISLLMFTLPCLQALDRLESLDYSSGPNPMIMVRGLTSYSIQYRAPLSLANFTMVIRNRTIDDKVKVECHVSLDNGKDRDGKEREGAIVPTEGLQKTLQEKVWSQHAQDGHWKGLGQSTTADPQGIGAFLELLDGVVRKYDPNAEIAGPDDGAAERSKTELPTKKAANTKTGAPQHGQKAQQAQATAKTQQLKQSSKAEQQPYKGPPPAAPAAKKNTKETQHDVITLD